jgi:hypothetical protein
MPLAPLHLPGWLLPFARPALFYANALLVYKGAPMAEEVGRCDSIKLTEIGDENVVLFSQSIVPCHFFLSNFVITAYSEDKSTVVSTIILRGATSNILDDTERSLCWASFITWYTTRHFSIEPSTVLSTRTSSLAGTPG